MNNKHIVLYNINISNEFIEVKKNPFLYVIIFYFNYSSTCILYKLYYNTIICYILLYYYVLCNLNYFQLRSYVYICFQFFAFYMVLDDTSYIDI